MRTNPGKYLALAPADCRVHGSGLHEDSEKRRDRGQEQFGFLQLRYMGTENMVAALDCRRDLVNRLHDEDEVSVVSYDTQVEMASSS